MKDVFVVIRLIAALLCLLALTACQDEAPDERACFEKLAADFDREANLASQAGNHDYTITAREAALTISVIFTDDDRNACDYVSAGPRLERK